MTLEPTTELAGGLDVAGTPIEFATAESFAIADYPLPDFRFAVVDFSHINEAVTRQGALAMDGVVGADILTQQSGIIDYAEKILFLRHE